MAQIFKTGDTVQLRSGGPEMTVLKYHTSIDANLNNYESDTEVDCEWFDNKDQRQGGTFHQDTLDAID